MNSSISALLVALLLAAAPALAAPVPVIELAPENAGQHQPPCPGIVPQQDEDGMPTTEVTRILRERYGNRSDACRLGNQAGQRKLHITDGAHIDQLRAALEQLVSDSTAFLEQDQQADGQGQQPVTPEQLRAPPGIKGHGVADLPLIGMLVPEPSSYAMLLAGLLLVAWRLRVSSGKARPAARQ
ncbi:PEP-CTERM protein-sorting domain-containing protein [Duganella sp. CF402]|uniref:PEP-CTERM sorting domain-containing protein n=1 Tax=unclassified Duganella TaxID=2636909 RepID=UPI0008D407A2|nr:MULTISPECIES: PEP-CTERM sorting domain-containing protein [unclassified Duganella]RZT04596.1 putative secreted protein with PEP-CTERM sorting signal [Duganella sp. BK701]SEM30837.1 PEP-CTERM protein-sorting domain-containing protein [Duganella sp. CF402]